MRLDMVNPKKRFTERKGKSFRNCHTSQERWKKPWFFRTSDRINILKRESRLRECIINTREYSIGMAPSSYFWNHSTSHVMLHLCSGRKSDALIISHNRNRCIITRCFKGKDIHFIIFLTNNIYCTEYSSILRYLKDMQEISAIEFRTNLKRTCDRVKLWENTLLRAHGKEVLWLVRLDWLNVAEQLDIVDTISQDWNPWLQEKIREIKLGVIRYYADRLVSLPQILTVDRKSVV